MKRDQASAAAGELKLLASLRGEWEAEPLAHSWQHPLLTAVAAVVAFGLADLLQLRDAYWAAISAVIVMQPDAVMTISASRERFLGTAVGAATGWLAALIWHNNLLVFGLALALSLMACGALGLKNAKRLCGATICLIVLVPAEGPKWGVALDRFIVVSFGIVIAVAISLVLHRWKRFRARRSLRKATE